MVSFDGKGRKNKTLLYLQQILLPSRPPLLLLPPYLHQRPIRQLEVIRERRARHVRIPGTILLIPNAAIHARTARIDEDPHAHLASHSEGRHFLPHGLDQADDLVAGDLGGRGGREGGGEGGEARRRGLEVRRRKSEGGWALTVSEIVF